MEHIVCTEEELSVIEVFPEVIKRLLAAGNLDELRKLIDGSWSLSSDERF